MARTYLIFGDIEGKLDVLNVECTRCAARRGADNPAVTIHKKATAHCPRRNDRMVE